MKFKLHNLSSAAVLATALMLGGAATLGADEKDKDAFDKAGDSTKKGMKKAGGAAETGMEKAGEGLDKGISATGTGVGEAVEHTGRGATTVGKKTAEAVKNAGEAIGDFFSDDDNEQRAYGVRDAQRALQSKGYYSGAIDGVPGPKTRSGLREFQNDNGLEATGKLDRKTAKKLGLE